MFKNIIWIKINTNSYYNIIIKLNDIGINILDNKKERDYILIKTYLSDYNKIKKYLKSYKISVYSNTGLLKIKDILRKYIVFIMSVIISIILLLFINNLIFKVDIKSNNKNIKKLLSSELNKYNLGVLKLKKNHKEIEDIVDSILDDNKDTLEWLEIKYDGLIMIVNVVEKTINKEEVKYNNCDVIAKSDAKIISMNINKGVPLREINDYVNKGDIIISGTITYNDEIKDIVCASAEVYGEVWYKVHVEMPLKEEIIKYTGKNRYNININYKDNEYDIFKSRIDGLKEKEITSLYTLNSFKINLVREKEYIIDSYKLEIDDAHNKALKKVIDKINMTLDEKEEILLQKVLKKEVNNSTIILDIFVVTKEDIGIIKEVKSGDRSGESIS
jgi:similar to stage IV sporulation protein